MSRHITSSSVWSSSWLCSESVSLIQRALSNSAALVCPGHLPGPHGRSSFPIHPRPLSLPSYTQSVHLPWPVAFQKIQLRKAKD